MCKCINRSGEIPSSLIGPAVANHGNQQSLCVLGKGRVTCAKEKMRKLRDRVARLEKYRGSFCDLDIISLIQVSFTVYRDKRADCF